MSFNTLSDAKAFALAGNALLTLESRKTGTHFTYRIRATKDDDQKFFVSLLSGPDNENDYQYLGLVAGGAFRLTKASKATSEAPSVKAFDYFMRLNGPEMPAQLAVYHQNKCGKCGRTLTVPESVQSGIGPECAKRM